jgi:DNA-binding SARP family transcriptional activator/TolB-like protein/tetratricopeptide (TPR) repeat protein
VQGRAAHKKRIALLTVLAVARGRPVGRERLLGLLWPDLAPDAARHNLSESLYVLRKELGEEVVGAGPAGDVTLNLDVVAADVAELGDALEAGDGEGAARLYRGPLLDGFYLPDAPEFERWTESERDRLARAVGQVLEGLAEEAEGAGNAVSAVGWWRRLAAQDPFNSRVALRLVTALDAAGERPEALRAARTHAVFLRQELGAEPDPALQLLVERLSAPAPPHAPARAPEPELVATDVAAPDAPEPPRDAGLPPVPPGPGPTAPEAGVAPRRESAPAVRTRWRSAPPRVRLAAAGVGLLLGVLVSGLRAPESMAPEQEELAGDPRRVAVLSLEDLSPGGELRTLATGITDRLIAELSRVPALEVQSRSAVEPYRNRTARFPDLVADLRVGSVVEGTLQRSGDSVWVSVSLVDAGTGRRLETVEVGRPLGDAVALQRDVAVEVTNALRRRVGTEVRRRAPEQGGNAEARALVRRAGQLRDDAGLVAGSGDEMDVRGALDLLARADSLLERAEAADRGWSRPTVERGWIDLARAQLGQGVGLERRHATAIGRAERVLARRAADPEALELRGTAVFRQALETPDTAVQRARLEAAEHDLRAAVEARPSLARGWATLSLVLRVRGRLAESDLAARRALLEDAYLDDAADIRYRLFFSALSLGDHARARAECAQGARQFPADWRFVECRLSLLRYDRSRPPDAAAAWRLVAELDRLDPPGAARRFRRPYSPVYRRMAAAAVSARAGDADSARAVVARARKEVAGNADLALSLDYDEAWVRLMLGDTAGARGLLRRVERGRPALAPYLARDPVAAAVGRRP